MCRKKVFYLILNAFYRNSKTVYYEKVVVNYANAFCTLGHKITVICGFKEGEYEKELDSQVEIVEFKARLRTFLIPLIKYLKNNKIDILYVPFHTYTSVVKVGRRIANFRYCSF